MREIGSDYNINLKYLKIKKNKKKYLYFVSCRNALKYLKYELNIKDILLPNYLCESIYNCFNDINIHFYKINDNFEIDINTLKKIKYIYIVNYFGKIDENVEKIKDYCKKNNIIILEDFTHNLLDDNRFGDICIASYRKTLATPYGAIIKDNLNILKNNTNIKGIKDYIKICVIKLFLMILKNISFLKFIWYPLLVKYEKFIDNISFMGNDFINMILYNLYDFQKIKNKRIINYNYLNNNLNIKTITSKNQLYFSYSLILKNKVLRDELRFELIKNKIYCPIYWDNSFNKNCNNKLSEKLLFIPIDQRYDINDMKRICKIINNFS